MLDFLLRHQEITYFLRKLSLARAHRHAGVQAVRSVGRTYTRQRHDRDLSPFLEGHKTWIRAVARVMRVLERVLAIVSSHGEYGYRIYLQVLVSNPRRIVHDLKHTFGRRLRVAGVCFEDRQALLGHKSESVTTDYSAAEIEHLLAQAAKVTMGNQRSSPTLTVLRRRAA